MTYVTFAYIFLAKASHMATSNLSGTKECHTTPTTDFIKDDNDSERYF